MSDFSCRSLPLSASLRHVAVINIYLLRKSNVAGRTGGKTSDYRAMQSCFNVSVFLLLLLKPLSG